MLKILLITIFSFFISLNSLADKRFEIDLKKLSKLNSFVNNNGNHYKLDQNIDKEKTIILIYTHGSWGDDRRLDGCNKIWFQIPPLIYQLDGSKLKDFTIKTYQLCSGARGWTQKEEDLFWEIYDKNNQDVSKVLKLKDKNGVLLINKWGSSIKRKIMKMKIDEFKEMGFRNIVLSGHSAGGWESLILKSNFSKEIDGVIALHPARSGKFAKKKKPHIGWINWRNYKISLIDLEKLNNVLVYSHDKDSYENTKTLNFLSNSKNVKLIDVSDTSCKAKVKFGKYHGITLTKCFAKNDTRSKEIIKYLGEIY